MFVEFLFHLVSSLFRDRNQDINTSSLLRQTGDVICMFISRFDTISDGWNSEGIDFQCLSHRRTEQRIEMGQCDYLCTDNGSF